MSHNVPGGKPHKWQLLLHSVHYRMEEQSSDCWRLVWAGLLWPSKQKCQQLPWVLFDFYCNIFKQQYAELYFFFFFLTIYVILFVAINVFWKCFFHLKEYREINHSTKVQSMLEPPFLGAEPQRLNKKKAKLSFTFCLASVAVMTASVLKVLPFVRWQRWHGQIAAISLNEYEEMFPKARLNQ